jgi:branched-chain amino acid transport system permease protein
MRRPKRPASAQRSAAPDPDVSATASPGLHFLPETLRWSAVPLALLLAVALPFGLAGGQQRTVTAIFMFIALAEAWNLIGGFAGYPSFGNVVFFGLGGYTTAALMAHAGAGYWVTLPAAGAMGAVFAAIVGVPILRLRGHYFAIATLGVAEGTREVVTNMGSITGGGAGITVPAVGSQATTAYLGNLGFYYLFLGLAALATLVGWLVARSRFGYGLRAVHQDEDAAASMGLNTTLAKIAAFMLSGLLTGLVGSAFAFQQVTIYPERLFDVEITVLMVVMVVIGGSGTVLGPLVGAVVLQYLSEYLRVHFTDFHTFIFGALIVLAVVFLPQGLVNFTRDAWRLRRVPLLETVREYRL